jgi:VWFA-related protein
MKTGLVISSAFLAVAFAAHLAAQEQVNQGKPAPRAASQTITLDTVVTDKSGAPVSGLEAADFKLFDNKQPETLLSVQPANGMKVRADPPVEVIVLVDAVNSGFQTVSNDRQWMANFLKESGGELALPTSVAVLTDKGMTMVQDQPTRDGIALVNLLDNSPSGLRGVTRSQGFWGAVDRRRISLQALGEIAVNAINKPGRKLLIWVGPGWPGFSRQSFQMTSKDSEGLFSSIVGLSTVLREARITLYSIDPAGAGSGQFYYEQFLKGVDSPKHIDYADLMLQVLATQSGGQVLFGSNDLASLVDRCIADARSYYVLTYETPAATHPNEYHKIEVQVDKPGLKARTRTGYYAQPTGSAENSAPKLPAEKP